MAKLTAAKRNKIPTKDFSGPDRSYPIEDMDHAKSALGRVSEFGTEGLKAAVRAKVYKKFPSLKD